MAWLLLSLSGAIPDILTRIRKLLIRVGLQKEEFVIRMTGCPNGCARPYIAELGFVGRAPNVYQMWLGADPNQTRLAQVYRDRVAADELETVLEPLFVYFKQDRKPGESFGDFCDRIGMGGYRHSPMGMTPPPSNPSARNGIGFAFTTRCMSASNRNPSGLANRC